MWLPREAVRDRSSRPECRELSCCDGATGDALDNNGTSSWGGACGEILIRYYPPPVRRTCLQTEPRRCDSKFQRLDSRCWYAATASAEALDHVSNPLAPFGVDSVWALGHAASDVYPLEYWNDTAGSDEASGCQTTVQHSLLVMECRMGILLACC